MKKLISKIISIVLAVTIILGVESIGFSGLVDIVYAKTAKAYASTNATPEGYVAENTFLENNQLKTQAESDVPKVLLIEDIDPWNSTANQILLSEITEYTKVTTSEFLNVDLSEYGVIVFANDQPFSTYDNYAAFKEYMEIFASIGGVIVFGACDAGWAGGSLVEKLPGDVSKKTHYVYNNYVVDSSHAIVSGILTEGQALVDKDLYSNYCSHVSFDEKSFPAGTKVILRECDSDRPTLIEYPLGKGRVIASGLTWEHNYNHYGWGSFARIAMEDMFRYAIRVSSIDVEELDLLEEWKIKKNAHAIIATDSSSKNSELEPIAGANVKVDSKSYKTDENGMVFYSEEYGLKTVTVSAEGYRERKAIYYVGERESRIFFMEKSKQDGKPYVVQATGCLGTEDYIDLRDQAIHFTEKSSKPICLYLEGNWNGHGTGVFNIYQDATANEDGKLIKVPAGNYINFTPGKTFAPGKQIKIQMVAKDGTTSEPIDINIIIDKAPKENGAISETAIKEGVSKFDWIGSHAVKSDNEIFTKLLTSDMSISSGLIPLEIAIEHNDDGTITYKGVLGLTSGEGTKNILHSKKDEDGFGFESPWAEFKKQIKGYKQAGDYKTYFENIKKKYARDWHPTKLRVTLDADIDVLGYLEITLDQNNKPVNHEGGIIINGKGNATIGQTFFAGPVPLYYEFKPGIEIDVKGGISFVDEDGWTFSPNFDGANLALPSISLEGGVGVRGVATLGLQGSGKLVFGFKPSNSSTGTLKFGGAIHAKVIWVVDYKWDFWNTEIPLWPKNEVKTMMLEESENVELSITSRNYLNNVSDWNSKQTSLSTQAIDGYYMTTLQNGVMPDAMPEIYQVGDKLIMVFLRDNPARATGDHTQLVYSVLDNGSWSMPIPVCESETADFFFDGVVENNKLYLTWQKSSKIANSNDPEALLEEVVANSEICYAVWDAESNSFSDEMYLTENETVDMLPSVTIKNGVATVSWISSNQNNILSTDGEYSVEQVRIEKGTVGTVEKIFKSNEYVFEMCAGLNGNETVVMVTTMDTEGCINLYYINDGKATKIDGGNNPAGLSSSFGDFTWTSDGKVYRLSPENGVANVMISPEDESVSSSYRFVSNGEKSAVIWHESAEDGSSVIKAAAYVNAQWCEPVVLIENIYENITFHDVNMLSDGRYAVIINTANYDEYGNEYTSMKYACVDPTTDIEITHIALEKADYITNKQEISFWIQNNSLTTVEEATVTIIEGKNKLINKTISVNLLPGEKKAFTEILNIDDISSVANAEIIVSTLGDINEENNRESFVLGHADVKLTVETYEKANEAVFVLTVKNASTTDANSALSIIEDSVDGIVLDVKNIGTVSNEESVQYIYKIDKSKVDFGENQHKSYFFTLSTSEDDWNVEDNFAFYTISKPMDDLSIPNGNMIEEKIIDAESLSIREKQLHFESINSESIQLHADVYPSNASVTYVEWIVENADIAHIDSEGNVTPLREGTTRIIAKMSEDMVATIEVSVGSAPTVEIGTPSQTTIDYGDSIVLHAYTNGSLPENSIYKWEASNSNFAYEVSEDGLSCTITPQSSGKTTFTITVFDSSGNVLCSDTQDMTSNSSFWKKLIAFFKKIIAFFKKIFGLTKG